MSDRLQKILARAGVASRRGVEDLIREGRVTVNGTVAVLGTKADPKHDAIKVDGKRVRPKTTGSVYLLLNKPQGVMSTLVDPEGRPTIRDLVPDRWHKALVPVGRLDFHTEGLLILTDDGDFAQRVAHPRYGCTKTYDVKVKGRPEAAKIDRLREGIVIDGRRTRPCHIESRPVPGGGSDSNSWWIVRLEEGRNRQIREMFFRIGHPVQKLRRVGIGTLRDPNLAPGRIRELTEEEVERLRKPVRQKKGRATARPAADGKGRPKAKASRPRGSRPGSGRGKAGGGGRRR